MWPKLAVLLNIIPSEKQIISNCKNMSNSILNKINLKISYLREQKNEKFNFQIS